MVPSSFGEGCKPSTGAFREMHLCPSGCLFFTSSSRKSLAVRTSTGLAENTGNGPTVGTRIYLQGTSEVGRDGEDAPYFAAIIFFRFFATACPWPAKCIGRFQVRVERKVPFPGTGRT